MTISASHAQNYNHAEAALSAAFDRVMALRNARNNVRDLFNHESQARTVIEAKIAEMAHPGSIPFGTRSNELMQLATLAATHAGNANAFNGALMLVMRQLADAVKEEAAARNAVLRYADTTVPPLPPDERHA